MTIHKAQGQEFPAVVVDADNIFGPGMLGVAISRVRSMNHLRVLHFNASSLRPMPASVIAFLEKLRRTQLHVPTDTRCCCQVAPQIAAQVLPPLVACIPEDHSSDSELEPEEAEDVVKAANHGRALFAMISLKPGTGVRLLA
jgi:hypothetical protein